MKLSSLLHEFRHNTDLITLCPESGALCKHKNQIIQQAGSVNWYTVVTTCLNTLHHAQNLTALTPWTHGPVHTLFVKSRE